VSLYLFTPPGGHTFHGSIRICLHRANNRPGTGSRRRGAAGFRAAATAARLRLPVIAAVVRAVAPSPTMVRSVWIHVTAPTAVTTEEEAAPTQAAGGTLVARPLESSGNGFAKELLWRGDVDYLRRSSWRPSKPRWHLRLLRRQVVL
jgi:hypothetical protein